jgi:2-keto-3-deoxy-L-rhamnonate aldolase RhmA
LSAAPSNEDNLKKKLDALKVAEASPLIPTIGIKISAKGMGTAARYVPEEGARGVSATTKG